MFKALILVALTASVAFAQNGAPGYHEHDGFYLAMNVGGGYGSNKGDNVANIHGLTLEGAPFNSEMDVRIGGCIYPNLALYFHRMVAESNKYDVKLGDIDTTVSDVLGHLINGVGVSYFFMPVNAFLGGTIGYGSIILDKSRSEYGFAFSITAGKEWWVSDNWGLGASVQWSHVKVTDDGDWTGDTVALLFSATFN